MTCTKLVFFLHVIRLCLSDWASEWMSPIQDQFEDNGPRKSGVNLKIFEDEYQKMQFPAHTDNPPSYYPPKEQPQSIANLKLKLEMTLENAKMVAELLNNEIAAMSARERALKDTISNGRTGISSVVVSTSGQMSRSYLVRDGQWSLCSGGLQHNRDPSRNVFSDVFSTPRCLGQEVSSMPDPCVFNSIIKYETIPTKRKLEYEEDDYLCLKTSFNSTLERYMSVPMRILNQTCSNGVIRSLVENKMECGSRVISDYTYYPARGYRSPGVPLEYCAEPDGACKLIVAWHVSNDTIENFEFLKNEPNFKRYFMKYETYGELPY